MGKKIKIPKNFGKALDGGLFEESGQGLYDFTIDFCNDHPYVKEQLKDALKDIAQIPDEKIRETLKWRIETLPDTYTKCLLMIGFALGQAYEVPDSKVQKDIDLVWKIMKEWKFFSMYPKHKAAA